MFDAYLIKKGDTIDKIADRYGVTSEFLMDINNLVYIDEFREGRELIVPKIEDVYFNTYKVEKGDTLYQISKRFNLNPELLSALNGIDEKDYIYPGQDLLVPKNGYSYYITADGDTLETVKDVFNEPMNKLISNNKSIYLLPNQLIVMKKSDN